MSEENVTEAEVKAEAEKKPAKKKSWFNRVWSAVTGLLVGVAGMLRSQPRPGHRDQGQLGARVAEPEGRD